MHLPSDNLKSDLLLLLTAVIWGVAFVAQRVGMVYVGPFTFNGIRFALGILMLLPFAIKGNPSNATRMDNLFNKSSKIMRWGGFLTGIIIFMAASLQQVGLVYTTAGKAGFITGLYVIIVPMIGLFLGQKTHNGTWLGAILAALGLYFLSVTKDFTIALGDLLVLMGAVLWAVHVHLIGWLSPQMNSVRLAMLQYAACSILSLLTAIFFESISIKSIQKAAVPILYGGLLSVGVAYTLQVVAQKKAHPAHAAILLSLEAVFAAIGGWVLLHEILSFRGLLGCILMLSGMLISQLYRYWRPSSTSF
jgi:drug/metabolite transporter (DMT)-like permease